MTTIGFMDASCRCGARIGWYGRVTDRPACRRCGYRPPDAELEAAQAEMDRFRQQLVDLEKADPNFDRWRKARIDAGLGLRSAAKILGIYPSYLSAIETSRQRPSKGLAEKMAKLYSGDTDE